MISRSPLAEQTRKSFAERESNHLRRLHLHHFRRAKIATHDLHLVIVNQDAFANRIERLFPDSLAQASALLAFAQRIFVFFSFGNVDDVSQDEDTFIRLNRIETDLDRHFAAVLTSSIKITPGTHRTRGWLKKETRALLGMGGAV